MGLTRCMRRFSCGWQRVWSRFTPFEPLQAGVSRCLPCRQGARALALRCTMKIRQLWFIFEHLTFIPAACMSGTESVHPRSVAVKRLGLAIVAIVICAPALSAFADTLELKYGSVI